MVVFLKIALYSVLVLAFLSLLAGSFVLAGKWTVDNSEEPDAH